MIIYYKNIYTVLNIEFNKLILNLISENKFKFTKLKNMLVIKKLTCNLILLTNLKLTDNKQFSLTCLT